MKHICWTAMLALMAATPELGTAQTAEQPEETEIAAEAVSYTHLRAHET